MLFGYKNYLVSINLPNNRNICFPFFFNFNKIPLNFKEIPAICVVFDSFQPALEVVASERWLKDTTHGDGS